MNERKRPTKEGWEEEMNIIAHYGEEQSTPTGSLAFFGTLVLVQESSNKGTSQHVFLGTFNLFRCRHKKVGFNQGQGFARQISQKMRD